MLSFAEFQKLDIRIGTITSAEKVEGTDKLLKLEVDLGDKPRQLVAGVADFYEVDEIIGKQVPVLTNLEPKTLRGVKSQGMILATDNKGQPVMLHPDQEVPNGSIVR